MKTLHAAEHEAIHRMNELCDELGIEWQKGGQKIRKVMLDATIEAFRLGVYVTNQVHKQENCRHTFTYNTHGGECQWCGQLSNQCSS